jgi:hypothetical protein
MSKRNAYILTLDPESERAVFSKKVLENIGFDIIFVKAILHDDRILSNRISMQYIYSLIVNSENDYTYVFEDDININEEIHLDEIIEYEKFSEMFFYLGLCEYGSTNNENTGIKINNHTVHRKAGSCRGLHAIGLSKNGAKSLLDLSIKLDEIYMDGVLEKLSEIYPANIVRYDLESYIKGHRGIIYQDRNRFPSTIP